MSYVGYLSTHEPNQSKVKLQIKPRARNTDNSALSFVDSEYVTFEGDIHLKLTSGKLLPKIWEDLYQWFGSAIAPKE